MPNPLFSFSRPGGLFAPAADEYGRTSQEDVNASVGMVGGLLAGLAKGAWAPVQYAGDVARGQKQVFDPATGHVGQEATDWAAGQAVNRMMPQKVAAAPGEQVLGAGPIKAYHGSPHDFDRFDLSRIGTGEGAQAYGHGLYFAENEGVARNYRDALSPAKFQALTPREEDALGMIFPMLQRAGSPEEAAALLDKHIASTQRFVAAQPGGEPEIALSALQKLKASGQFQPKSSGRMYEVAIHADPDRFLDWDRPLVGQPKGLDQALKPAGTNVQELADVIFANGNKSGLTGERIYNKVADFLGSPEDAALALRQGGIPGIRYLDQGSRGAGSGSRNYVTFSDDIIEILRKYGLAGLGIGVPAGAAGLVSQTSPAGAAEAKTGFDEPQRKRPPLPPNAPLWQIEDRLNDQDADLRLLAPFLQPRAPYPRRQQ